MNINHCSHCSVFHAAKRPCDHYGCDGCAPWPAPASHRYGDSLWGRFLRWLMPANGEHAKAQETGELPVYRPEKEPPRIDPRLRETRYDLPLVRPYVKDRAA